MKVERTPENDQSDRKSPAASEGGETQEKSPRKTNPKSRSKHRDSIAAAANSGDKSNYPNRGVDAKSLRSPHASMTETAKQNQKTKDGKSPGDDRSHPQSTPPPADGPGRTWRSRHEYRTHIAKLANLGDQSGNTGRGNGDRHNSKADGTGDKSGGGSSDAKVLRISHLPITKTADKKQQTGKSPEPKEVEAPARSAAKLDAQHRRVTGRSSPYSTPDRSTPPSVRKKDLR